MAITILIKFCGLIVAYIRNPTKWYYRIFPEKSLKLEKYILNFFSLLTQVQPTHQSRSNSLYRVLLQIFLDIIFVFGLPLKLRVVHIGKNYKISIFSKIAPTKLIKFCRFTVHSKPSNETFSALPDKIPETEKEFTFLCNRRLTERLTHWPISSNFDI